MSENTNHIQDNHQLQEESVANGSSSEKDAFVLKLQQEIDALKLQLKTQKDINQDPSLHNSISIGNFKLGLDGIIHAVNQYGAKIFKNRTIDLIDTDFNSYISPESQIYFFDFFENLKETEKNQKCEIQLSLDNKIKKFVRIEGIFDPVEMKYLLYVIDISKLKIIEDDLLQYKIENTAIVKAYEHIVFRVNNEGVILSYRSPNEELLFDKPENFLNKKFSNVLPNQVGTLLEDSINKAFQNSKSIHVEYSLLLESGEHFFESRVIPINNNEVLIFINDITSRKKEEFELIAAEKKALENEARFNALQDASFGGIGIHDKGVILECNQGLSDMTGYTVAELIGMDGLKLIADKSRQQVINYIQEGYEKPYEEFAVRKNGEEFPIRLQARNVPYNGEIVRTVEFRDITDQKRVESEIIKAKEDAQRNETFYNAILNHMGDPVFVKDDSSRLFLVNDAFCELFEVKREYAIGKTLAEHVSAREKEAFIRVDNQVLFDGIESIDEETITFKNTETKTISTRKTRFVDHDGKKYLIGIIRDISNRKKTEIELLDAKEKAEQADQLKSAFLANMSHEIRTPMNGILGFAELLKEPNLTGEKQQEYIKIIEESGERMLNIINDIISISKIEAGLMEVHHQYSNVNEQVDYIYNFFLPEVVKKGLNLSHHNSLPLDEANITTDREKLFAILTNLVKNAIKHTEKGSIDFGYTIKDKEIIFHVKDSGIGIPDDRKEAIFKRFIQADITNKMALQGAGLGLSISKAYVEMLGGKLWLESQEGLGSTFYFTLPYFRTIGTPQQIKVKEKITTEEILKNKLKILIAEDDKISELLISLAIKNLASEIIYAKNGLEAIDSCKNNPDIDLVLMDMQMPKMDGHEATQKIRKFNKDIIIIAQTANALSNESEIMHKAGCNDIISKPIQIEELKRLIVRHFK